MESVHGLPAQLLVVGAGLLGTSLALGARRAGTAVWLSDSSPTAVALARDIGAGTPLPPTAGEGVPADEPVPDIVAVCVPPDVTAAVVEQALDRWPGAVVTDVASVKGSVVDRVRRHRSAERFVGGHPMAGRERGGPLSARPDLFEGRPWVLTPVEETGTRSLRLVRDMARSLGAVAVQLPAAEHDEAVALVSHLPQVVASLVAGRLHGVDEETLTLAGPGLRDVIRIAGSDPLLWAQILAANAGPVGRALSLLRADLDEVLAALARLSSSPEATAADGAVGDDRGARAVLARLIGHGNEGLAAVPGKHGTRRRPFEIVAVAVPDRPGEIGRLLSDIGAAGVNVEDMRLDHALGRPSGVVEIAVEPDARATLTAVLRSQGWQAVG